MSQLINGGAFSITRSSEEGPQTDTGCSAVDAVDLDGESGSQSQFLIRSISDIF